MATKRPIILPLLFLAVLASVIWYGPSMYALIMPRFFGDMPNCTVARCGNCGFDAETVPNIICYTVGPGFLSLALLVISLTGWFCIWAAHHFGGIYRGLS